jgi:hypothetical protein
MFIFPPPPPPDPQRITAVEPAQLCPRLDLQCRIEYANDVLEGVARLLESSARSDSRNSGGGVVVTPGTTGQLTWTGFAPTVVTGSAQSAA